VRKIVVTNTETSESIEFSDYGDYGILELTGMGIPDLFIGEQKAPSQDGSTPIEVLLDPREIDMEFNIPAGTTPALAYEYMRKSSRILNCKSGIFELTYTNDYGSWYIECTPDGPRYKEYKTTKDAGIPYGKVTFYCYDPYWQDEEDTVIVMSSVSEAQEVSITGDVPSPIAVEITGDNGGFAITEAVQGVKLEYGEASSKLIKMNTGYGLKKVTEQNESIWSIKKQGVGVEGIIVVDGVFWGTVGASVVSSTTGEDWVVRMSYKGWTLSNLQHDGEKFYLYITTDFGDYSAIASSEGGIEWGEVYLGKLGNDGAGHIDYFFIIDGTFVLEYHSSLSSKFLKSTDRGLTHTPILSNLTSPDAYLGGWIKAGSNYLLSIGYVGGSYIYTTTDLTNFSVLINGGSTAYHEKFASLGSIIVSGLFYSTDGGSSFSVSSTLYQCPEACATAIFAYSGGNILYTVDGYTWVVAGVTTGPVYDIKYNSVINRIIATNKDGSSYTVTPDSVVLTKEGMPITNFTKLKIISGSFYLYGGSTAAVTTDFSVINTISGGFSSPYDIAFLDGWFYVSSSGKLRKTQDFISYTDAYSYNYLSSLLLTETDTELFLCLRDTGLGVRYLMVSVDGSTFTTSLTIPNYGVYTTKAPAVIKTDMIYLVCTEDRLYSSTDLITWSYESIDISVGKFYKTGTDVYLFDTVSAKIYISNDSGVTFVGKDLSGLFAGATGIISITKDADYIYIVISFSSTIGSSATYGETKIYRSLPDLLYWERYDDGAIFPINGIFYEEGLYGLYGDNGSVFATDGDNTPVNKIQNLTADSKFFSLQPGQNILKLDVDTGLAVAKIRYRQKYIGV